MSADDGWIIRKDQGGMFVLQHYVGDSYPDISNGERFSTLESAVLQYEEVEAASSGYPSEYGLTVRVKDVTYPKLRKELRT